MAAVGRGPPDPELDRITELFRKMDDRRINNTFNTAPYYFQFHLNMVEEVIFALREAGLEPTLRVTA